MSAPASVVKTKVKSRYGLQLAVWGFIVVALWWWPDESKSKFTDSEKYLELSAMDVVTVKAARLANDIAITGTLNPGQQTILNARVAGEIKAIGVREGQAVRAGQTLVVQDDRDLTARLQQADASLATAKAEAALAKQRLDQTKPLFDQQYASANDLANAERQLDIKKAQVKSAEVSLSQARQQLADMVVRAPFNGVIAERLVDSGQSVQANAPLLKIVDLSQLELVAQVAASEVSAIQVGQMVHFSADGFDNKLFAGRISRINPVARNGSRRVDVYAVVDNSQGLLRAGLFAKGTIQDSHAVAGVAVPFSAIQERAGKQHVHVIRDNRLVMQEVGLGRRDENRSLVLVSGVKAGERVLLLPPLPGNEGRMVRMKTSR